MVGHALIVLVDCIDQGGGDSRAVALDKEWDLLVGKPFEFDHRFFYALLIVEHDQDEWMLAIGQFHPAAGIDPLDCQLKIAHHRFARVGEGTGQAVDHADPDRFRLGRSRLCQTTGRQDQ